MKKFIFKSLLFGCLTVFPLLAAKLFMPLDWYAFRTTEVLEDQRDYLPERGPYYPHQHHRRMEEGDIGRRTRYAVKRDAEWFTDEYGYRNRLAKDRAEVVIVGRSEIAGLSLTQDDMLSEALQVQLKQSVYAYAPKDFDFFLRESRFRTHPPKVVIFSMVERSLADLLSLKDIVRAPLLRKWSWFEVLPEGLQIYIDQMKKKPWIGKFIVKSLIYERFVKPERIDEKRRMLFFSTAIERSLFYEKDKIAMKHAVDAILSYRDELARRNIRFIFLPVPNKETVYWDWTGQTHKPKTLSMLSAALKAQGVEVVDLEPNFSAHREEDGQALYHLDDTHWNSRGVHLAARLLQQRLGAD